MSDFSEKSAFWKKFSEIFLARDERDKEMSELTNDLADLIPYAEELKKQNEKLKVELEEFETLNQRLEETESERQNVLQKIQAEHEENER